MYLEHFGLREAPFRITPHADFFFGGANRSALLDALVYALGREEGLVKVSGEVGTGKTMLARVLTDRLPAHLRAIYLADPLMNRAELLAVLADELGCQPATSSDGSAHRLLRTVQEALVAEFAAGRQVMLLIDEAHAMPADTLEQIRLLSNLESERHKLIKIALFGQPELDDLLARADMRQLKDRITQHFRLDPLLPADVATYLDFRLRAAGYRGPPLFEAPATARIARESGGLTRRINVLADKALLSAYARGAHSVGDSDAMRAVVDTQVRSGPAPRSAGSRIALTFAVAAALVAGGYLLGRGSVAHPAAVPVTPPSEAPSPTPTSPPTTGPAPESSPAPILPPAVTAAATLPGPRHTEPMANAVPAGPAATDDPLESLLATSRQWSGNAPGEHWFIQLMSAPAAQGSYVQNYLQRARRSLDPEQLRIYRTDDAGGPQIAVIYGDFPDQRSALQSLAGLPDWITASRPLPRQVHSLRPP